MDWIEKSCQAFGRSYLGLSVFRVFLILATNSLAGAAVLAGSNEGTVKPTPDFVVYRPADWDGADATNEHFLVTPTRSGDFLAIWTQASQENEADQRIVMSRSSDRGHTWSALKVLAGDPTGKTGRLASWAFPFVVPGSGRVYLFWNQNIGVVDAREDTTGALTYMWSDDEGKEWSARHTLPIRKSRISNPTPDTPENFVIYQPPVITSAGVLVGLTRWASMAYQPKGGLFERQSEIWFLRFDNILTETDGAKLSVTTLPEGNIGIEVPCPDCGKTKVRQSASSTQPDQSPVFQEDVISVAQEPTVVALSDGRLISLMRTRTGYVHYALSRDAGRSWDKPRPLRFKPGGDPIPQPLAPSPLYKLHDGRFVLIFHNNRGDANGGKGPTDSKRVRRPVFIAVGREVNDPDQPLAFTEPRLLADNGGVAAPKNGHTQIGTYPSLFEHDGKVYFWYPDRKHFLYGMIIPPALLRPPK